MTDHDRLLAATHDPARDWREGKACGGRDGWHERGLRGGECLEYSVGFFAGQARSHKSAIVLEG